MHAGAMKDYSPNLCQTYADPMPNLCQIYAKFMPTWWQLDANLMPNDAQWCQFDAKLKFDA